MEDSKDGDLSANEIESEEIVSFSTDSHFGSNIGSIREFNVNTKEKRDSVQDSAKRDHSSTADKNREKGSQRSRQNLLQYPNANNNGVKSFESI